MSMPPTIEQAMAKVCEEFDTVWMGPVGPEAMSLEMAKQCEYHWVNDLELRWVTIKDNM
jgi:hypothetical protein